ncbi:hypothetical protein AAHC03_027006 [Spirometra sp. Aus1]
MTSDDICCTLLPVCLASALQQPTEDLHTEGRMPNSTDSHRDPTLDEEHLVPRDFTATVVNSHSIILSWEAPRRSNELNGLYELTVSNRTHEENSYLWATEDRITDLEPSTTYNFTIQAFWKNDTPVDVVAVTSARTRPRGSPQPQSIHITCIRPYAFIRAAARFKLLSCNTVLRTEANLIANNSH